MILKRIISKDKENENDHKNKILENTPNNS